MEISLVIFTFYYSLTIRRFIFLIIKKRKVLKRVKKKTTTQYRPQIASKFAFSKCPTSIKKKKSKKNIQTFIFSVIENNERCLLLH